MSEYDYTEFTTPEVMAGSNSLGALAALAQEQLDAEAAVAQAQAILTRAQEKLKDVSERRLPELMEEIGMKTFQTRTGLTVSMDEAVRAAVPKAMRERAWAFIRAQGDEGLIKRKVIVEFGKGQDAEAAALSHKLLGEYGTVSDESSVHPSTLAAYVRGKLEKGVDIPLDVFGVHKQRVAKIERPK